MQEWGITSVPAFASNASYLAMNTANSLVVDNCLTVQEKEVVDDKTTDFVIDN